VAGYRIERRQDRVVTRKIPSWVANRIIRWITGVSIRDVGCSLKVYRRELLDAHAALLGHAPLHPGSRRQHWRARASRRWACGTTRGGAERASTGCPGSSAVLADLMSIKMIRSFRLRPLVLFARLAAAATAPGHAQPRRERRRHPRASTRSTPSSLVFPSIALLWFALALFLMMLGLVGEVAIHQHRRQGLKILPLMQMRLGK
jgi:hypothetical protein